MTCRFAQGTTLTRAHAEAVIEAASRVASATEPFGVLVDASGVSEVDAEYRTTVGAFYRGHRDMLRLCIVKLRPELAILVDMLRVASQLQVERFDDEASARAWLSANGVGR